MTSPITGVLLLCALTACHAATARQGARRTGGLQLITFDIGPLVRKATFDEAVAIYAADPNAYCNKCDHDMYPRLLRRLSCCNDASYDIISGGLNSGELSDILLATCSAKLHGFEVREDLYEQLLLKYSNVSNRIVINNLGLSNSNQEKPLSDIKGEMSGIFTKFRGKEVWEEKGTVYTTSLTSYIKNENLNPCVAIIDVEGHESKVMQGMDLFRNKMPAFAFELGGTWTDERKQGTWSQTDAATFLENLGYRLYLIGKNDLLPVNPKFFNVSKVYDEGGGFFVQGNALAVHKRILQPNVWQPSSTSSKRKRGM